MVVRFIYLIQAMSKIDNHADEGGAVYFDSNGAVTDCNFIGNTAISNGGAVYFYDKGTVTDCNFTDNKAYRGYSYGGAIFFNGNGDVINCNFVDNHATYSGGAIYFNVNSMGSVTNCNFINNSGEYGGAIYIIEKSVSIKNCYFTNNQATYGGAIVRETGSVENCNFNDNHADQGGAVYLYNNSAVTDCKFTGNTANNAGGAVFFENDGEVSGSNFTDNKVTSNNGRGGAVYANGNVNVKDSEFYNNQALIYGGAVYFGDVGNVGRCEFYGNIVTEGNGGAVYMNSGSVTSSSFTGNNATSGSAIYFSNTNPKTNNTISNSIFLDNRANVDENIPLHVTLNDNQIEIIFSGQNNLINAIYSNSNMEVRLTSVTYWSSEGISTTGPNPVKPSRSTREAGQNITVGIVNNAGIVFNDVIITNDEGKVILNQNLDGNFYISIRHDEDTYYTSADYISSNMRFYVNVTSLTTDKMTVNLTANSNIYNEVVQGYLQFVLPNGDIIDANYGANGTWWAEYTFDDYGVYPISALYNGLNNVNIQNGTVIITDTYSTLTLEDVVLNIGESINLTVMTKNATGITAMIDGKEVSVVNNFTIPISGLDKGNYTLTVTTIPVFGYNSVTKNATITVISRNTNINVDVAFGEIVNDVRITATVNPSATGVIEFVIGDKLVYVPVNKGKAVYEVFLPLGDYDVDVYYSGDSVFNPNSTSKSFSVKEGGKKDTVVIATPMVNGESVSIMVVVTDRSSSSSNDLTNYLSGLIGGGSEGGSNDALNAIISGAISAATGTESGEYSALTNVISGFIGDYLGGGNSGGSGDSDSLTALITNIAGVAAGDAYGPAGTIAVNLVSNLIFGGSSSGSGSTPEGSSDINGMATIKIDNVEHPVEVRNGMGVFTSTFTPGRYDADVEFLGNDKYNSSSTSTSFTVKEETKKDTTIIATPMVNGETVSIMVVVTDGSGASSDTLTNYLFKRNHQRSNQRSHRQ